MNKYKDIKNALKKQGCNVKYFTPDFYNNFLNDRKHSFESFISGNGWAKYSKTENSDFYNKNGSSYCVFLEIYNSTLQRFRVDFFNGSFSSGWDLMERQYINFETDEQCKKWAKAYNKYKIYDVNKTA